MVNFACWLAKTIDRLSAILKGVTVRVLFVCTWLTLCC
jgi:hypothetical protein